MFFFLHVGTEEFDLNSLRKIKVIADSAIDEARRRPATCLWTRRTIVDIYFSLPYVWKYTLFFLGLLSTGPGLCRSASNLKFHFLFILPAVIFGLWTLMKDI